MKTLDSDRFAVRFWLLLGSSLLRASVALARKACARLTAALPPH